MNQPPTLPFPRTWWIQPGRLLGGCYPGDLIPATADQKLIALLDVGVCRVICLQPADEVGRGGIPFAPYIDRLQTLAAARGQPMVWSRCSIPDMGIPTVEQMRQIITEITATAGLVYVHCWGGHGRTGTVAGCWLREKGLEGDAALRQITTARSHDNDLRHKEGPQTSAQRRMVQEWKSDQPKSSSTVGKHGHTSSIIDFGAISSPQNARQGSELSGPVLGMAVGDALGTTLEFSSPAARPWQPPLTGPHVAVTGGGPFRLVAGQVTDDTQMAICLARVLAKHGSAQPQLPALMELADAYAAWRGLAFDIGGQTSSALRAFVAGRDPASCGLQAWRASGGQAAGNGSLMRTAPIGTLVTDVHARKRWAIADALITHADPRCILAGIVFNEAIAAGVGGGDAAAIMDAARQALNSDCHLASTLVDLGPDGSERWAEAQKDLVADLDAAACTDPWLNGESEAPTSWPPELRQSAMTDTKRFRLGITGSQAGFVRVAFRLAFYQLMHASDWGSALIDTVNRGGDADTNGAIVGALLGARFGTAGIPADWKQRVLDCDPPAPWHRAGLYHPHGMLGLITAL